MLHALAGREANAATLDVELIDWVGAAPDAAGDDVAAGILGMAALAGVHAGERRTGRRRRARPGRRDDA